MLSWCFSFTRMLWITFEMCTACQISLTSIPMAKTHINKSSFQMIHSTLSKNKSLPSLDYEILLEPKYKPNWHENMFKWAFLRYSSQKWNANVLQLSFCSYFFKLMDLLSLWVSIFSNYCDDSAHRLIISYHLFKLYLIVITIWF